MRRLNDDGPLAGDKRRPGSPATPPAGGADMGEAFLPSEHMALTFAETFTDEEAAIYAAETLGPGEPYEPWMAAGCGRARLDAVRPLMLQSSSPAGLDLERAGNRGDPRRRRSRR